MGIEPATSDPEDISIASVYRAASPKTIDRPESTPLQAYLGLCPRLR